MLTYKVDKVQSQFFSLHFWLCRCLLLVKAVKAGVRRQQSRMVFNSISRP